MAGWWLVGGWVAARETLTASELQARPFKSLIFLILHFIYFFNITSTFTDIITLHGPKPMILDTCLRMAG